MLMYHSLHARHNMKTVVHYSLYISTRTTEVNDDNLDFVYVFDSHVCPDQVVVVVVVVD